MQGVFSLSWAAAFLYAVFAWRILSVLRTPAAKAPRGVLYGASLALVLHALAVYTAVFSDFQVHFGFALALSCVLLAAVFVILVESVVRRVTILTGFVLLLAAPASLVPELFPAPVILTAPTFAFKAHIGFALAAYGFIVDAAVQAVLISVFSRKMKHPDRSVDTGWLSNMPDLMAMERILFRIVVCAFLCLSCVLIFGALTTSEVWHVAIGFDHKTVLTWLSWLFFAVLLAGRYFFHWRGRVALCWFWAGAGTLAVAYLGYRFMIEIFFS